MDTIERQTADLTGSAPSSHQPGHEECEQCGAAVDATQRYCVVCGGHRRHVHDPATRHLMTTTAQARTRAGAAGVSTSPRRRSPTLGVALVLALIPVVAAVGVAIGRSGSGDDKLLAALKAQKPQVINTGGSASGTAGGALHASKVKDTSNLNPAGAGKVLSTTSYGTAHQITGFKATPSQLAQGKQIVQHIQQTQGKDYVAAQRGLPDQISVP